MPTRCFASRPWIPFQGRPESRGPADPEENRDRVGAGTIGPETPRRVCAMKAAGEGDDLAIALAPVFSGEIDFNSEVQPGDGFAVVFERFEREGGRTRTANPRRRVSATMRDGPARDPLCAPGGKPAYYDAEGRSLRRFFLKSPLKFEPRVTSGFSLRRMHPVLHTARAHRGSTTVRHTVPPLLLWRRGPWCPRHSIPPTAGWCVCATRPDTKPTISIYQGSRRHQVRSAGLAGRGHRVRRLDRTLNRTRTSTTA